MKIYLLFGCILIANVLLAQGDFRGGFIIKSNGDLFAGYVDYRSEKKNEKECVFRTSLRGKKTVFGPDELRAYGYWQGKRYETFDISGVGESKRLVIGQILVRGPMSLMMYNRRFYVIHADSIIELRLPKTQFVSIDGKSGYKDDSYYKGQLNYLMRGCSLSAERTKYEEVPLAALVRNYNRCKGNDGMYFKERLPASKISLIAFGGYEVSALNQPGFQESSAATGGLGVEVSAPRIFDKVFASLEVWYAQHSYRSNYVEPGVITNYYEEVISMAYLKFPVGLRYSIWNDANSPYVRGGMHIILRTSSNHEVIREMEYAGTVTTSYRRFDLNPKYTAGFWAAVGYSKVVHPKVKVFAEARYESSESVLNWQPARNITSTSFLFGVRF